MSNSQVSVYRTISPTLVLNFILSIHFRIAVLQICHFFEISFKGKITWILLVAQVVKVAEFIIALNQLWQMMVQAGHGSHVGQVKFCLRMCLVIFPRVLRFSPHLLIGLSRYEWNNLKRDVKLNIEKQQQQQQQKKKKNFIDPLVMNGLSQSHHFGESIFIYRGIRSGCFLWVVFFFHFSMNFLSADRIALMGRRILWCHIWDYSVCLCAFKGRPGLYELTISWLSKGKKRCWTWERRSEAPPGASLLPSSLKIMFWSLQIPEFFCLSSLKSILLMLPKSPKLIQLLPKSSKS